MEIFDLFHSWNMILIQILRNLVNFLSFFHRHDIKHKLKVNTYSLRRILCISYQVTLPTDELYIFYWLTYQFAKVNHINLLLITYDRYSQFYLRKNLISEKHRNFQNNTYQILFLSFLLILMKIFILRVALELHWEWYFPCFNYC